MISTANSLIYSAAAVRRMFGLASGVRVRVRKFWRVCWVHIAGKRPTFISLKLFKAHFVEHRMKAAEALGVSQWQHVPQWFTVTNPKKESSYPVVIAPHGPVCRCEDFKNQTSFFGGEGCCKHGYAVLRQLGYSSLLSYRNKQTLAA